MSKEEIFALLTVFIGGVFVGMGIGAIFFWNTKEEKRKWVIVTV